MSDAVIYSSVGTLAGKLLAKELSAVELTEAFLDRIESVDHEVGAFLLWDREDALARRLRCASPQGRSTRSARRYSGGNEG